MSDILYAHSLPDRPREEWELLERHLAEVAELAGKFAAAFGGEDLARTLGLLHDIGKASDRFQRYLRDTAASTDHSTAGAQFACARYGPQLGKLLAFCVAGHHAGLADGAGAEGSTLAARLTKRVEDYHCWQELALELPSSLGAPASFRVRHDRQGFQLAFLTRMLFSCLVDADSLCTERFTSGGIEREAWPTLAALKPRLDAYLARRQVDAADSPVNRQRRRILDHVRAGAACTSGLFSLTVPTGGGKTLTSLAFALDHAARHGHHRVIYVIPFTSVVEQTAAVFREALGADTVLEHHSAFDADTLKSNPDDEEEVTGEERHRQAAENWDAPVVVTTAVQFFESLFAAARGRCRKLHNIASSVVILDEAQTLPLHLLLPCVAAIDELARNYRASVVLMTATQPALKSPDLEGGLEDVRELAPAGLDREPAFQRVRISHASALDNEALAEHLKAQRQVLCVVNSRRHARELYEAIKGDGDAFHLSTLMYAVHRRTVLATIRARLRHGMPVRLVSTSLIEAGVDISFPTVFRAESGLDQIAQAAGRCNREGELPAGERGQVVVFEAASHAILRELRPNLQATGHVRRHFKQDELLIERAIQEYFLELLFQKGHAELDKTNSLELRGGFLPTLDRYRDSMDFPFRAIDSDFQVIRAGMVPIIIARQAKATLLVRELEWHALSRRSGQEKPSTTLREIARRVQPYIVQVRRPEWQKLKVAESIALIGEEMFGEQFAFLTNPSLYCPDVGLSPDDPTFMTGEAQVIG